MMNEVSDSSVRAIEELKRRVDAVALRRAVEILDSASSIHVVGYNQASWIAGYLFFGLTQLGCRSYRVVSPADAARQNVSALGTDDLVVAICLSDDDDSAVRVALAARAREVPVLAFAHSAEHPLARASNLFVAIPASPERRFQPWAAHMVFVQALLAALEARRAERI